MREQPIPFYFGGFSRPLFGCYHPPAAPARDCGYALCPPLGHEFIQFHRAFRQLAALLSDAGFPVLRFDFQGCGDSQGDHERWGVERWVGDIQASIDELRRRADVSKIGLVGLRLGGALSVLASDSRDDIDAMVLWDSVLRGGAYLEELRSLHERMVRHAHVKPKATESRQEMLGFPMPDPLVADLAVVDLLAIQGKPASRVLVIESNASVEQEPLRERLASLGSRVEHQRHFNPHLWVWIEDFGKVHVPHKILQAVVSWACQEPA